MKLWNYFIIITVGAHDHGIRKKYIDLSNQLIINELPLSLYVHMDRLEACCHTTLLLGCVFIWSSICSLLHIPGAQFHTPTELSLLKNHMQWNDAHETAIEVSGIGTVERNWANNNNSNMCVYVHMCVCIYGYIYISLNFSFLYKTLFWSMPFLEMPP